MPTFTIPRLQNDPKQSRKRNQYRRTPTTKTCRSQIPQMFRVNSTQCAIHDCPSWCYDSAPASKNHTTSECCQTYGSHETKNLHKKDQEQLTQNRPGPRQTCLKIPNRSFDGRTATRCNNKTESGTKENKYIAERTKLPPTSRFCFAPKTTAAIN